MNQHTVPKRPVAVRIELSRALVGAAGNVTVLELVEPTLGDWIDCGAVTRRIALDPRSAVDSAPRVEIIEDAEAFMRWMVRLSGHSEALLRTMSIRDARAVCGEIGSMVRAFEADEGNLPNAPTS